MDISINEIKEALDWMSSYGKNQTGGDDQAPIFRELA